MVNPPTRWDDRVLQPSRIFTFGPFAILAWNQLQISKKLLGLATPAMPARASNQQKYEKQGIQSTASFYL